MSDYILVVDFRVDCQNNAFVMLKSLSNNLSKALHYSKILILIEETWCVERKENAWLDGWTL